MADTPSAAAEYRGRFKFAGSLRARAARGTLINTAFSATLGLLALAKGFVLAGFLSRADYGVWGIIAVSLSTLVWFKQAGIGDKFVQQDEPDQEIAFQRAFTVELTVTVACVLLILAAIPVLVLIYNLPKLIAPSAVIAGALLLSAFQSPLWIYYRGMEYARTRALAAIEPVTGFLTSVGLAAAGAGYWAFVGGIAAGILASAVVAVFMCPYRLKLRFERAAFGRYWSFSAPLLLAGFATFVMSWSAVIAAKLDLGVAAVGVIALADNISSYTERVDDMVTGALYPAICAVRDRLDLLYESLVKSNRLALMWAVPFGIGIALFSNDLVRFGIGEHWRPAIVVLELYGISAAIYHVGFNWTAYFRALDRTRPIAVATVVATVVFLATGIPLLLAYGLTGFALGILLQGLAMVAVRAYFLQQIFPGFDFLRHAARSFLPTVPGAAAVLAVRALGSGHTLGMAIAQLVAYAGLTALATWSLESNLLREAVSYVRGTRTLTAAS